MPTALSDATVQGRGFALRWSAIISAVVTWNALLLADFARNGFASPQPGPMTVTALLLAFVMALATLFSSTMQNRVLRPGRTVGEIRPLLQLVAFVTAIMAIVLCTLMASGQLDEAFHGASR
jgi:hypothetical protein